MIAQVQKGDLVVWSATNGRLHAALYMGSGGTYHFWPLNQTTLNRLAEKKKPYVDYISGSYTHVRVAKITPECLDAEELRVYKEIKGIK